MNINDYQIKKEEQEKIFIEIAKNAEKAEITDAAKNIISNGCINYINKIQEQREIIYKELENGNSANYGDHGIQILPATETDGDEDKAFEFLNTQLVLIDKVLKIEESIDYSKIINQSNQKLSTEKAEQYGIISAELRIHLGSMIHNAKVETKEEHDHVLTEEDIKNNPDMEDQGLKVGDTITIANTKEDFSNATDPEALSESAPSEGVKTTEVQQGEPAPELKNTETGTEL